MRCCLNIINREAVNISEIFSPIPLRRAGRGGRALGHTLDVAGATISAARFFVEDVLWRRRLVCVEAMQG